MRRPKWILALLLALAVAAGFAWLAQWQAGHAVAANQQKKVDTETPRPLNSVASATVGVTEDGAAVVVTATGEFEPDDFVIVEGRVNAGETGAWVVGNYRTTAADAEDGAHLAVGIGWAPTVRAAERAAASLAADPAQLDAAKLTGRYMPPEAPQVPKPSDDPQVMRAMTSAHLANVWQHVDGPVYSGFLVLHHSTDAAITDLGLDVIDSVAPMPDEAVNWLNVFYALEWLVFAGFAVFFWWRLTRDAWEKEHELLALAQAGEDPDQLPAE